MNLFSRTNLKADSVKVKQVKTWIAAILNLDEQITISLNQLTCHYVSSEFGISPKGYRDRRESFRASHIVRSYDFVAEIQQSDIYQLKAK